MDREEFLLQNEIVSNFAQQLATKKQEFRKRTHFVT